jgi:hypothetical protein
MINEVKLRSTIPVDNTMPASYDIKGKKRILLDEYNFVEIDSNQKPDYAWPKEVHIQFTTRNIEKRLFYETDDSGKPLNPYDHDRIRCIKTFYMEHPLTLINGKPHPNTITGSPVYYDIIDVNIKVVSELKEWDNKHRVASHLSQVSYDDLRDICYYYGVLPKGKTRGSLLLELADYNRGILFSKIGSGDSKSENYIKVWMTDTDPDKMLIINCRKAIDLNIITTVVRDGHTTYYLGQEMLGPKLDDVVLFAKQNKEAYEQYILKGINEKDQYLEESAATALEKKSFNNDLTSNFMDEENLRKAVYELYDEAFGLFKNQVKVAKSGIKSAKTPKLTEFRNTLLDQINSVKKKVEDLEVNS